MNTVSALVLPRATLPNACDVGAIVSLPGASAVPVRVAVKPPTVSMADTGPAAPLGWNTTRIVQLVSAATAPEHVPPLRA